jgi:hypothetical protein
VECLIHGNIIKLEALKFGESIEAKLRAKLVTPLAAKSKKNERKIEIGRGKCMLLI